MRGTHVPGGSTKWAGFTLVEVIVVLLLLALTTAIVAPSLLSSRSEPSSELPKLVRSARDAAVRRGETVRLRVDRSGAWRTFTETSPRGELLMSGRLSGPPADSIDLVFSPLGTCAPAIEVAFPEALGTLDPLTCQVRPS